MKQELGYDIAARVILCLLGFALLLGVWYGGAFLIDAAEATMKPTPKQVVFMGDGRLEFERGFRESPPCHGAVLRADAPDNGDYTLVIGSNIGDDWNWKIGGRWNNGHDIGAQYIMGNIRPAEAARAVCATIFHEGGEVQPPTPKPASENPYLHPQQK
jgi:hypothetical protein